MATVVPEKLTLDWMLQGAKVHLIGSEEKWQIIAWNNVVYLKISGMWTASEVEQYVNRISGIPALLGETYEKICLVFEISDMKFKPQEARQYPRGNWLKMLEQPDLSVLIVEGNAPRRQMWRSLHVAAGKRDRVRLFADTDQALAWLQAEVLENGRKATDRIGEFLVRVGAMTLQQVEAVLQAQAAGDGRKFGEIALEMGFVTDSSIERYVDYLDRQP